MFAAVHGRLTCDAICCMCACVCVYWVQPEWVDVTAAVQRRVETSGGGILRLSKGTDNVTEILRIVQPILPGVRKVVGTLLLLLLHRTITKVK